MRSCCRKTERLTDADIVAVGHRFGPLTTSQLLLNLRMKSKGSLQRLKRCQGISFEKRDGGLPHVWRVCE